MTKCLVGSSLLITAALLTVTMQAQSSFCDDTLGTFGWQCTTADDSGDMYSMRLIYGNDGTPLVTYESATTIRGRVTETLKFATRGAAGTWLTSTIDAAGGYPTAIRVNPVTGRPAVSYGCVKFAERTATGWTTQTVASFKGSTSCGGTTFAFDPSGVPYLAYSDTKSKLVSVGSRLGTSWSFQTLTRQAYYMSLDIGPDGQPAVAIEDLGSRNLVYASRTAVGSWQYTTVDIPAPGSFIARLTLRFDAAGVPTIAYWTGSSVRFARRDPTTGLWTVEVAVPDSVMAAGTDLDYANGEPVIAARRWNPATSTQYITASRRDVTTGQWHSSVVTNETGIYANIGYDAVHGLVGIAYDSQPASIGTLRFAEGPAGAIGQ